MQETGSRVHVIHHHIVVHEWNDALATAAVVVIRQNGQLGRGCLRGTDGRLIVPRSGGCTDGHLLVLPRGHVADFTTDPVVSATVQLRAAELAAQIGGRWSYLTSCGPDATQTVFHLHGHLVPRTADEGLALRWTHPTSEQEPVR
ncbi:HIT domain-containing protein [Streptomyces sp. ISL-12]|uniref:HIT family protein n=1 Tax=Streptomyces sp. ISL-12 TaxID=2819177 RepID=UPI001BE500EE|nr:HIT domain-containing protein [Streptomyces sp. ISL-12]MBT2413776.1 HIT domain-containing protein [Streptomyces sp. ISL-12]